MSKSLHIMTGRFLHITWGRLAAGTLVSLLLLGCATQPRHPSSLPPLRGLPDYPVADADLLTMSPEMEAFLDRYVPRHLPRSQRAWAVSHATIDPMILGFKYDSVITLNAAEAFSARSGNCLAFSSMLVTLARHAGLNAWYQEVEVPPQWSSNGDTFLLSIHVNAVVASTASEYVLDVSGKKQRQWTKVRRITDAEAEAQYYNNLGADGLLKENLAKAYGYFAKAIQTAPHLPYLWSNLGVAYNRNGQPEDAIWAYETALRLNPSESIAINNLHGLHEMAGNFEAAEKLRNKAERNRLRNPYYLLYMAEESITVGNYDESNRLLKRAMRLDDEEYRLHFAMARSKYLSGDSLAAESSLERAKELAPDSDGIITVKLADLDKTAGFYIPQIDKSGQTER